MAIIIKMNFKKYDCRQQAKRNKTGNRNVAGKRMIDPNIWQSEDFSKLSTLGKLVFIGLFSLADDEGRGRCNPVFLKSTLFPYEEGMHKKCRHR